MNAPLLLLYSITVPAGRPSTVRRVSLDECVSERPNKKETGVGGGRRRNKHKEESNVE
jgi:hypothetical protein